MKKTFMMMFLLVLFGSRAAGQRPTTAAVNASDSGGELLNEPYRVYIQAGEPLLNPHSTPAPANLSRRAPTADIQVTYVGNWPAEAQNAFEYATTIWETIIQSPVPITIEAEFGALPENVLGGAGPNGFRRDFTGATIVDTWYPTAIVNALSGFDRDPSASDIGAIFSSEISWYYGIDANPPGNQFDFVSVVLHEIGHGLGFTGSMRVTNGVGTWGLSSGGRTSPVIYDRFTLNGSGQVLLTNFPNNTTALGDQLTSNNLFFAGPNATAANGNQWVELFAPSTWIQGSSYSHLGESFNDTADSLMTFSVSPGVAEHMAGPVILGMFVDMGWQVIEPAPQEPTFSLPGLLLIEVNQSKDNVLDLWDYAADAQSADSALTFQIIGQTDPNSGVTIDSNRYIDVNPAADWLGTSTITIRVTDADNNTADSSFVVESITDVLETHLPLINSN